jgi:hypothetical protein
VEGALCLLAIAKWQGCTFVARPACADGAFQCQYGATRREVVEAVRSQSSAETNCAPSLCANFHKARRPAPEASTVGGPRSRSHGFTHTNSAPSPSKSGNSKASSRYRRHCHAWVTITKRRRAAFYDESKAAAAHVILGSTRAAVGGTQAAIGTLRVTSQCRNVLMSPTTALPPHPMGPAIQ